MTYAPFCWCSWDPIFEAEGFGQTYAEMDKEVCRTLELARIQLCPGRHGLMH